MLAEVLASFGRQHWIRELPPQGKSPWEGKQRIAVTRGRRQDYCVGDIVQIEAIGDDQAVINQLVPRRNLLLRSDQFRRKHIAANIDQIGLVLAAEPPFSEALAVRVLVAATIASIPVTWLINKSDCVDALKKIESRLELYRAMSLPMIHLSALHDGRAELSKGALGQWLQGKSSLLLGQSGMGKSTLVNRLVPDADLKTQQWSRALNSGKHTTSFSKSFDLPEDFFQAGSRVIDSPGFQQFGLAHCSRSEIEHSLPEWTDRLGQCRYHNCRHLQEPDCVIRGATERGEIDSFRYQMWVDMLEEQTHQADG